MIARARAVLQETAPAQLVLQGGFAAFRVRGEDGSVGRRLRGLTRCLDERVFSAAALPWSSWSGDDKQDWGRGRGRGRGRSARGRAKQGVGRTRGKLIDKQLTSLVNGGRQQKQKQAKAGAKKRRAALAEPARPTGPVRPTGLAGFAMESIGTLGLRPVVAQRAVADAARGVGTAADILAVNAKQELVVVEVKCGFSTRRHEVARAKGVPQRLRGPLAQVDDCAYARHMSQLCATREMLVAERDTLAQLRDCGLRISAAGGSVRGVLVYVSADAVEGTELPDWWLRRGKRILEACAARM